MNIAKAFKQKSPYQRFLFVLGAFFMLIYLSLGITFILWTNIPFNMPQNLRVGFGALLIIYAIFRLARLMKVDTNNR